jgi:hypothetical protein
MKQTLVAVLSVLLPLTALLDDGFRVSYGGGSVPEAAGTQAQVYISFQKQNPDKSSKSISHILLSPKLPKLLRKERGQPSTK